MSSNRNILDPQGNCFTVSWQLLARSFFFSCTSYSICISPIFFFPHLFISLYSYLYFLRRKNVGMSSPMCFLTILNIFNSASMFLLTNPLNIFCYLFLWIRSVCQHASFNQMFSPWWNILLLGLLVNFSVTSQLWWVVFVCHWQTTQPESSNSRLVCL